MLEETTHAFLARFTGVEPASDDLWLEALTHGSTGHERNYERLEFPDMGLTLQDLSGQFDPGVLEVRYGILKVGAHSGRATMTHPGDEICCVVKGAITFHVGDGKWTLSAGDTIHFKSDQPHRWENAARGRTEVIWVFSDGLSF